MAMAALAGATDVFGLARLHDLFVSFMSGNTTMMALAIGEMKWARAGLIAEILALFLGGVALGAAIGCPLRSRRTERHEMTARELERGFKSR